MAISLPWSWHVPGTRRARRRQAVDNGPAVVTQAAFGGRDEEPAEWVTVYWAQAIEEAHIIRGALEAEDIPVRLESAESSSAYGSTALRGVRVWVPRVLEDRARTVLEDLGHE